MRCCTVQSVPVVLYSTGRSNALSTSMYHTTALLCAACLASWLRRRWADARENLWMDAEHMLHPRRHRVRVICLCSCPGKNIAHVNISTYCSRCGWVESLYEYVYMNTSIPGNQCSYVRTAALLYEYDMCLHLLDFPLQWQPRPSLAQRSQVEIPEVHPNRRNVRGYISSTIPGSIAW